MPKICKVCGENEVPPLAKKSGHCNECAYTTLSKSERPSGFYKRSQNEFNRGDSSFGSDSTFKTVSKTSSFSKKPIKMKASSKSRNKQLTSILNFKEYAKRKIENTLKSESACECLECKLLRKSGQPIPEGCTPRLCEEYVEGMNTPFIAHLFSGGAHPDLYLIQENSFYLCWQHHMRLDQNEGGKASDMMCWGLVQSQKRFILDNIDELRNLSHNKNYLTQTHDE